MLFGEVAHKSLHNVEGQMIHVYRLNLKIWVIQALTTSEHSTSEQWWVM